MRLDNMMANIYKKYSVSLDKASYEIVIGRNIFSDLGSFIEKKTNDKRVIVIVDSYFDEAVRKNLVSEMDRSGFETIIHLFDAGKQNKNINEAIKIYEKLEANNFARDSTMIAVGGGVIGDLAGFVASTYLRGMNLIHIPTTLTAMIDSSIGGKVALNFKQTVNAIGNYYHPLVNVIDLQFIDTLSDRDYRAGIAEIIKCGIICRRELHDYLLGNSRSILNRVEDKLLQVMYGAIEVKLLHVTGDVNEQGKRLKLNYGHTLGHAIETSTGVFDEVYRHGEGVAIGMVGAAYIARHYYGHQNRVLEEHEEILRQYSLPIRVETDSIGFEHNKLLDDCLRIILKDKKRKANRLRFILPLEVGKTEVCNDVPEELILNAYRYLIEEGHLDRTSISKPAIEDVEPPRKKKLLSKEGDRVT